MSCSLSLLQVVIMARRANFLEKAVEMLRDEGFTCEGVQGDVRDAADCENAVRVALERGGRLDILVNAAAGNFLVNASELSAKGFATVWLQKR
jgi:peroxisomal 2,4-dienoyl-CoA reductase